MAALRIADQALRFSCWGRLVLVIERLFLSEKYS